MGKELNTETYKLTSANSRVDRGNCQFASLNVQWLTWLLLAGGLFLLVPQPAVAAETFPRGPGFYFSIPKLLTLLLLYFCWVRTCWWVNVDAVQLGLTPGLWNLILFGTGFLGLLAVWLLPWYWPVGLPLLLILYLTPSLVYINLRNGRVPEERRVLTERHFK